MSSNYGSRSKTVRGLKMVIDSYALGMDGHCSNQLIENNNLIEHYKVSVGLHFDRCFKNVVLIRDHADAKKF